MIAKQTLYKRDKTGKKILVYNIWVEQIKPDDSPEGLFSDWAFWSLKKETGQLGGKLILHEDTITVGKQKRSVEEQARFEMQSAINAKKDEGYKSLEDMAITELDGDRYAYSGDSPAVSLQEVLEMSLPKDRTDASGNVKPMKCTATNDTKTGKLLEKVLKKIVYPCDAQTKLDGVRSLILHDGNDWRSISSSGKPYDVMARFILDEVRMLEHRGVITRDMILDGEFYKHGVPLQKISGWARKQSMIPEHEELEFHIFDLPSDKMWLERLAQLEDMFEQIPMESKLKLVSSNEVRNIEEAEEIHNYFVEQGYEGLILRNTKGKYEYGIRSSDIFKMKDFQDDEFVITGAIPGKRGAADMVFSLRTMKGQYFEAKPLGTWQQKEAYMKDLDNLVGKMATVRFLTYSEDGIPVGNPVLKVIRDYED